jgi:hypothetical protein
MMLASSAGNAVAMAVGGIVAVLLISAVFYFIGRGEDRDRAATPSEATPAGSGEAVPGALADGRPAGEPKPAGPRHPPRAAAPARRRRRP